MSMRAQVQELKAIIDTPTPSATASIAQKKQLSNLHGLHLGVLTDGVEHAMLRCRESVERYNTAFQKAREDALAILEQAGARVSRVVEAKEAEAVGRIIHTLVKQRWLVEQGTEELRSQGAGRWGRL